MGQVLLWKTWGSGCCMHDNHVCPLCQNMSLTEIWHEKTRWLMIATKYQTSTVGGGGGGGGIQEKPTSREQRNVSLLSALFPTDLTWPPVILALTGWSAAGCACPVRRRSRHVSGSDQRLGIPSSIVLFHTISHPHKVGRIQSARNSSQLQSQHPLQ